MKIQLGLDQTITASIKWKITEIRYNTRIWRADGVGHRSCGPPPLRI